MTMKKACGRAGALTMCGMLATALLGASTTAGYRAEIEKWRQDRETRLKSDGGWLTVSGLFWLKEGPNRFGSDPSSDIVLPAGAPAAAGVFEHRAGRTIVRAERGTSATVEGRAVTEMEMAPDSSDNPTVLALGDLTMFVVQRGEKFGIRLKDKNSRMRREFTGLKWYPIQPDYRVTATYTEYDPPKQIPIPTVLGTTENMASPGYLTFKLRGKTLRLDPVLEDPDARDLFIIFRDQTSGDTTYGAGRFLYADKPVNGKVVLDFNQAYSPPCAFTPFATCPLPPPQNRLAVRLEAGEMKYGGH
jgi:hypothetical protein